MQPQSKSWCRQHGGKFDREVDMGDETLTCKKGVNRARLWTPEESEPRLTVNMNDSHIDVRYRTDFGTVKLADGSIYNETYFVIEKDDHTSLIDMDGYAGDLNWTE